MLKNPFLKFIITFAVLVILWFSFYENIYSLFEGDIQRIISIELAHQSTFFIQLLGYSPIIDTSTDYVITSVEGDYINHGVWIGEPCNGLKVFGLFAIFILAFQGKWIHKLWYIPLGIFILHLANAIRIAVLTIISAENPTLLDFNHNITFQVLVYSIVFGLWYFWVNKFSKK
jgi:exosortase family protein XrtF